MEIQTHPSSFDDNSDTRRKFNYLELFQTGVIAVFNKHARTLGYLFLFLILAGYFIYLGFAIHRSVDDALALVVITSLVVFWIIYRTLRDNFGTRIYKRIFKPLVDVVDTHWDVIQWLLYPCLIICAVLYVIYVIQTWRQIQSMIGLVVFLLIPFLTSKYPSRIHWRPVIWGMALQFILGIAVLRWRPGYLAVKFLSEEINKFLGHSFAGAALAFGDPFFLAHPFFMAVLPLVIYVGAITGILYHYGLIQSFVSKMGFLMRITLGTTGIESVSLALNVFLSVAETVLILKPYIPCLTKSEFHTLLVSSHATIAGFAYAFFVLLGVNGQHLLTAAVMSAPAAIAISKLNFPETEESVFKHEDDCQMETGKDSNAVEAMGSGAWQAGKTVGSIMVQLIAFYSIYSFLDSVVSYLGDRVGIELSFHIIFSYVFMPVAYMFGVEWEEAGAVGSVLGLKLTASEVLGYMELGKYYRAATISPRALALTTYAICGFSSFGTLAMFVGVWHTVDPSRVNEVAGLLPRIYMNTNLACFLTACVAGMLYDESGTVMTSADKPPGLDIDIHSLLGVIPSYKTLLEMVNFYG